MPVFWEKFSIGTGRWCGRNPLRGKSGFARPADEGAKALLVQRSKKSSNVQIFSGTANWATSALSERSERITRCSDGCRRHPQHQKRRLSKTAFFFGAADRTRTGTPFGAADFKSAVSAVPPQRRVSQTFYSGGGKKSIRGRKKPRKNAIKLRTDVAIMRLSRYNKIKEERRICRGIGRASAVVFSSGCS